ncbi:MAG: alpha/beta hydrolase [Alphaproteobacteria bacterium]|nr:alpha/beta hydrolase [Alphaproteobacteria bacterium]
MAAPELHRIPGTDGLTLAVHRYAGPAGGRRLPVLCLPGLTRNARDFEAIAPVIARTREVLCLSFRGRGLSDRDPEPARYQPPTYVGEVIATLDAFDCPQAVFLGTSLGGLVTMLTAALHPDRLAAAILNDVGPEVEPEGIARIRAYVGRQGRAASWREAGARLRALNADVYPDYGEADWERMARQLYVETGEGIVPDYDPAISVPILATPPTDERATDGREPEQAAAPSLWPVFEVLGRRPLLLLRGGRSDILSVRTAERMRACAPGMLLCEVPDRGHAPSLAEPVARTAIEAFLEGLP